LLVRALGDRANIHVQAPFAAPGESEPEPDIAVVPPGDYLDEHPRTAWLIVEVAESSVVRDRAKARLYAAAGVTEYWIVNLTEGVVEVHRDPHTDGYAGIVRCDREQVLTVPGFPDVSVAVSDFVSGH
jgi:Uma2 family endonuclease